MISKEEKDDFGSSGDESPNESHNKLLSAVSQLYKKQRVEPAKRSEPTGNITEFNLSSSVNKKGRSQQIFISDLARPLKKKPVYHKVAQKVEAVERKSSTLPKPLEKIHLDKIERTVGYENLKSHLGRWDALVEKNRAADQLKFPLPEEPEIKIYKPQEFLTTFSKPTELELKVAEVLNSSKFAKEEEKKEKELFPLSLEEIIEKRKMMARVRAQESYKIAKATRQNKIKSKKFHRIQRQQKVREELKEFEALQKTDPEAALEKLQKIEKSRAEERATLRHRSTGKWARGKAIHAKYDKEARIELAEQLARSRDLTQKLKLGEDSTSEEELDNDEESTNLDEKNNVNPWVNKTNEVEEFVSGYRRYWQDVNKQNEKSNGTNEPINTSQAEENGRCNDDSDTSDEEDSDDPHEQKNFESIEPTIQCKDKDKLGIRDKENEVISSKTGRKSESVSQKDQNKISFDESPSREVQSNQMNRLNEGGFTPECQSDEEEDCGLNQNSIEVIGAEGGNSNIATHTSNEGNLAKESVNNKGNIGNICNHNISLGGNNLGKDLRNVVDTMSLNLGGEVIETQHKEDSPCNSRESSDGEKICGINKDDNFFQNMDEENFELNVNGIQSGHDSADSEGKEDVDTDDNSSEITHQLPKSHSKDKITFVEVANKSKIALHKTENVAEKGLLKSSSNHTETPLSPLKGKELETIARTKKKELQFPLDNNTKKKMVPSQDIDMSQQEDEKESSCILDESVTFKKSPSKKLDVIRLKGNCFVVMTDAVENNSKKKRKNTEDGNIKKKPKFNGSNDFANNSGNWVVSESKQCSPSKPQTDQVNISDIFDTAERKLVGKVTEKLSKIQKELEEKGNTRDIIKTNRTGPKEYTPDLSFKKPHLRTEIDEELLDIGDERIRNSASVLAMKNLITEGVVGEKKEESKEVNQEIDPKNFLSVKPVMLKSQVPDIVEEGGEDAFDDKDEDDGTQHQMNLVEAFADDNVVDEFRKEKEDDIKESQPQDIDLTLPGWGSWGGACISKKKTKRKKRRFIIKAPLVPRKDKAKENVIINEKGNEKIRPHLVNELPYPFTSVKEFEASIRAPIGSTWVPQTAHLKLTAKPVLTRMGTVIEPMTEKQLLNREKNEKMKNFPPRNNNKKDSRKNIKKNPGIKPTTNNKVVNNNKKDVKKNMVKKTCNKTNDQ